MSVESSLPEGYLEQREKLHRLEKTRISLTASINRYLGDGVRTYSKFDLGVFADEDWVNVKNCIARWESRGLLRIVKPIDEALSTDVVIEMLNYIDQKSPWPNWPAKSA